MDPVPCPLDAACAKGRPTVPGAGYTCWTAAPWLAISWSQTAAPGLGAVLPPRFQAGAGISVNAGMTSAFRPVRSAATRRRPPHFQL